MDIIKQDIKALTVEDITNQIGQVNTRYYALVSMLLSLSFPRSGVGMPPVTLQRHATLERGNQAYLGGYFLRAT